MLYSRYTEQKKGFDKLSKGSKTGEAVKIGEGGEIAEEAAKAGEEAEAGGKGKVKIESGIHSNVFKAPEITTNSKGELTNGTYTLNQQDMLIHVDGKNPNKSQFLYDVDANKATI